MGSNKSWLAILLGTAYALFSPSAIFAQQTETDSTRLRLPDSFPIVQRIGIDLRPTYIAPTHEFLRGANNKQHALRKAFSAHLKWAFQFHPFSETGSIYPHTYQGIGLSYNSFESTQEIGSPTASMFSRDQELPGWDATCLSTTNGTSELPSDGILMTRMTM